MVIGLAITRLLPGIARLIQHSERYRISAIHQLRVFSMLVELARFWWWEFALSRLPSLTFRLCLVASLRANKRLQLAMALLHIVYRGYCMARVLSAQV